MGHPFPRPFMAASLAQPGTSVIRYSAVSRGKKHPSSMYSGMDGDKAGYEKSLVPSFVSGPLSQKFGWPGVLGATIHVALWLAALVLSIMLVTTATSADQGHAYELMMMTLIALSGGLGLVLLFTLLHMIGVYKVMPGGGPAILLAAITGSVFASSALVFLTLSSVDNDPKSYWPNATSALSQSQIDEHGSARSILTFLFLDLLVLMEVLKMNIAFKPVD